MSGWAARDPRAKVALALAWSVALTMVATARTWWLLPPVALLLATAGLPAARWRLLLRSVLWLWGLSVLVNAFLIAGERLGPESLGWFRPTREGLRAGLGQGARLAGLAGLGAWVVHTTGALELVGSLEWSLRARPAWRRAAHRALVPVVLALRLLPALAAEGARLLEIDRLRHGPRRGRAAALRLVRLAPLWLALVLDRAESLALALRLRGYRPGADRGFARPFRMGGLDWAVLGVAAAGCAALGWG